MAEFINSEIKYVALGESTGATLPPPIATVKFDVRIPGRFTIDVNKDGSWTAVREQYDGEWRGKSQEVSNNSPELDKENGELISRKAAIYAVEFGITYAKAINKSTGEVKELFKEGNKALNEAVERLKELPSAQPEKRTDKYTETHACDCISRQDAIEHLKKRLYESALNNDGIASYTFEEIADNRIQIWMDELPPSPHRP